MQPVILYTDVASLSHKGRLPDSLTTRLIGRRPLITFITLGELTKWAEIGRPLTMPAVLPRRRSASGLRSLTHGAGTVPRSAKPGRKAP